MRKPKDEFDAYRAQMNERLLNAENFGIANLVGGTIVIPHTRKAMEFWDNL
ncbi:MAG: hypothetical protein U9R60_05735 [Bacteroidota bacterium]|nr:hypothetical protein [Bacteroidota bacterium]